MKTPTLKNYQNENKLINSRIITLILIIFFLFSILSIRQYYLQVLNFEKLNTKSEENRILIQPIPANRGIIYDNRKKPLATNISSKLLSITPERTNNLNQTLHKIESLINISNEERKLFFRLSKRKKSFDAIPLKLNLSNEEIAIIAVNLYQLPGVSIDAKLLRYYPEKNNFSHILGYLGRLNEREYNTLNINLYEGTDVIGKVGLEKYYENKLIGKPGYQKFEVNAKGRVIKILEQVEPQPGIDLHLYLNKDLQKIAMQSLKNIKGSVVAIDPKSGGVLTLVSSPSFDPNLFITGIGSEQFNQLNKDPRRPLFNRATLGEYPPASTIKPAIGLAMLKYNIIDKDYHIYDQGWYQISNKSHRYRNWKRRGDGWVNLQDALIRSNDTFFYKQALKLGINKIHNTLNQFGLGKRSNIDIHEERAGILASPEWKKKKFQQPWYPGETIISIIGQGYNLSTPLQLAILTTVIANRGKYIPPKIVKNSNNDIVLSNVDDTFIAKENHWNLIIDAMQKVMIDKKGTAYKSFGKNTSYSIAGKTGTAQVVNIPQGEQYNSKILEKSQRDHSLFIAFAPIEDPKIAISVVVENDKGATSVAKKVIDHYLITQKNMY